MTSSPTPPSRRRRDQTASATRAAFLITTFLLVGGATPLSKPYTMPLSPPFALRNASPRPPSCSTARRAACGEGDGDASQTAPAAAVDDSFTSLSRRDTILLGCGALGYGKLVSSALQKVARGNAYPSLHEDKVRDTFRLTLGKAATNAAARRSEGGDWDGNLRVLEVGVGADCRTVARGLYSDAARDAATAGAMRLDLVGVDAAAQQGTDIDKARATLRSDAAPLEASFEAIEGDIASLPYPSGYFDAITCSLVLCSVSNPPAALQEILRLLNPRGGTFGFVEHVAVEEEDRRSFLEWQQVTLDPLQQAVAHNCHLHRDTYRTVMETFGTESSRLLFAERFFIDDMWPVSCQCRAVVERWS